MCVHGKEDSKDKSIKKHSPTCLGDSLRFTVAVSAFYTLWLSVADVVNCFQNTMRDENDRICMSLPPHYLEWFKLRFPNIPLPDTKEKLIIRLFNVCQGSADAGKRWNNLFNKIMSKLGLQRTIAEWWKQHK